MMNPNLPNLGPLLYSFAAFSRKTRIPEGFSAWLGNEVWELHPLSRWRELKEQFHSGEESPGKERNMWIQQGDVTLKPQERLPEDSVPTDDRILVEGEHTDHNHVVVGDVEVVTNGYELSVVVKEKEAPVTHPEHGTVPLSPGITWVVGQVNEYDHFTEESRAVLD